MTLKEELSKLAQYLREAEEEYAKVSAEIDSVFKKIEVPTIEFPEMERKPKFIPVVCRECTNKHLAATSKILKEALTFARAKEEENAVKAVRDAVAELAGLERDIPPTAPEKYLKVLQLARELRKTIFKLDLEYKSDVEKLEKVSSLADELREFAYTAMKV